MGWLSRALFGMSGEEAPFAVRGFHVGDARARVRLEAVGGTCLHGYHAALEAGESELLGARLNEVDRELRGFAFEGAAMGLALLDHLTPWKRNRLHAFLGGVGEAHAYMVHVGVGWAIARLPWLRRNVQGPMAQLDPLLRWLVLDGFGFHEGYFHWPRTVKCQAVPAGLSGYALRAFDQGVGRSLWFVEGADVARIAESIAAFDPGRRADLWSGVGLACAYAGGTEPEAMEALVALAGRYRPQLAQGAAFAAQARRRAGNSTPHTELACEVLCGVSAHMAAQVTDDALEHLPPDGAEPAYEVWRRHIQVHFAKELLKEAVPV